jgi:hypothetical protein
MDWVGGYNDLKMWVHSDFCGEPNAHSGSVLGDVTMVEGLGKLTWTSAVFVPTCKQSFWAIGRCGGSLSYV